MLCDLPNGLLSRVAHPQSSSLDSHTSSSVVHFRVAPDATLEIQIGPNVRSRLHRQLDCRLYQSTRAVQKGTCHEVGQIPKVELCCGCHPHPKLTPSRACQFPLDDLLRYGRQIWCVCVCECKCVSSQTLISASFFVAQRPSRPVHPPPPFFPPGASVG